MTLRAEEFLKLFLELSADGPFDKGGMRYEQFNSAEGTRIHGFALELEELAQFDKQIIGEELSAYLAQAGIRTVDCFDAYLTFTPENLSLWYDVLEMQERPEPPAAEVQFNDQQAANHPLSRIIENMTMAERLIYEAETINFRNQSRVYLDRSDKSELMVFFTNADFLKLHSKLSKPEITL